MGSATKSNLMPAPRRYCVVFGKAREEQRPWDALEKGVGGATSLEITRQGSTRYWREGVNEQPDRGSDPSRCIKPDLRLCSMS